MCVTYCHRRRVLFWNHVDCADDICSLVGREHGHCGECRNARDGGTSASAEGICGLTNAPIPDDGRGCCHFNVDWVDGLQVVTPEMLAPLGFDIKKESIIEVLDELDAPYHVGDDGTIRVEPEELELPQVYGVGTEPVVEDEGIEYTWSWDEW